MGYGMNQSMTGLNNQLRPLISFMEKLQKEMEEEDTTNSEK